MSTSELSFQDINKLDEVNNASNNDVLILTDKTSNHATIIDYPDFSSNLLDELEVKKFNLDGGKQTLINAWNAINTRLNEITVDGGSSDISNAEIIDARITDPSLASDYLVNPSYPVLGEAIRAQINALYDIAKNPNIDEDAIEDGAITIDKLDPAVRRAVYNWAVLDNSTNQLTGVRLDNTEYGIRADAVENDIITEQKLASDVKEKLNNEFSPAIDRVAGAVKFEHYCPIEKGTIGATVTDGTRWKTKLAVRIEDLDNVVFTLNTGYKAMLYLYKEGWTSISPRPVDPDGDGWIIHAGTYRLATFNGITETHRNETIGINVVIASDDGTTVITETQAKSAFKLEELKSTAMQKIGEAMINKNNGWYFNVPVHLYNGIPFSVFIKSNNSTVYPHILFRVGTISSSVQDFWLNGVDLSNGYLITVRDTDKDSRLLMLVDDVNGDYESGATIELYANPQLPLLEDAQFKTHWKDTIVVAASNSKARYAQNVDYFCDGINDEIEIQNAINDCCDNPMKAGNVVLLGGDYHINSFPEYDASIADRRTVFLVKSGVTCVNIKGSVSEQGVKLHIHTDELDEINETVDIFACGVQGLQGSQMNIKNLRIIIDDQNHPMIVINNYYTAASKLESIRMYALGYGAGKMPVEGLIGIQCSRGSDNGVGQTWSNIGVTGFYEAFRIGSEHLVATDLLSRNSYYGYTFGNYDYNLGWCVHPNVLINCADEFSAHLPLFARNGGYDSPNINNGMQEVHLIGFNLELRNQGTPTGTWALPAEETQPGTWCGHIDFVSDKNGGTNSKNIQFWKEGHGHNFETINGTHRKGGTTSERNSYYPQYMQTYFDTDLNQMLIYNGTQWTPVSNMASKLSTTAQTEQVSTDNVILTKANGSIVSVPYRTFVNAVLTKRDTGTGNNITDAWYNGTLKQEIAEGDFSNVNIGDVLTGEESGHNYVVVDFDYFRNTGPYGNRFDNIHHIVLMAAKSNNDASASGKINATATTAGGFKASKAFTTDLPAYADGILTDDFGDNLISFPVYVSNAVTNGKASGAEWVYVKAMLPNEVQLAGYTSFGNAYDTGTGVYKFQLFNGWKKYAYFGDISLRCCDIVNDSQYSIWSMGGYFAPLNASQSESIRPYFCLGVTE